jgi:hypothetical protein
MDSYEIRDEYSTINDKNENVTRMAGIIFVNDY